MSNPTTSEILNILSEEQQKIADIIEENMKTYSTNMTNEEKLEHEKKMLCLAEKSNLLLEIRGRVLGLF